MRTVLPLLLVALAAPALAQSPANEQIPYQGYLTDDGAPVSDPALPLTFCLGTGGSADWCEDATVAVVDGTFSHAIGSVDAITGVDFGRPVELFITVDDATALPPVPLGAAPASRAVALGDRGLRVPASGVDGVEVAGAAGNGLAVRSADLDGLYVTAAGGAGVRVGSAPIGLHVESAGSRAVVVGNPAAPAFEVAPGGDVATIGGVTAAGTVVTSADLRVAGDIEMGGTVSATHVTATGDVTATTVDATAISANRVDARQGGSLSAGTFTATGTAPTLSLRRSNASGTLLVGHNAEAPGPDTGVFAVRANGDVEAAGDLNVDGDTVVGGDIAASGQVRNEYGVPMPVAIGHVQMLYDPNADTFVLGEWNATPLVTGVTVRTDNPNGRYVAISLARLLPSTQTVVMITRVKGVNLQQEVGTEVYILGRELHVSFIIDEAIGYRLEPHSFSFVVYTF